MPFYVLVAVTALSDSWLRMRVPLLIFIGMKSYAICFYHLVEFTSDTPPPHPVNYFAAEGPYLVAIGLMVYKLATAASKHAKAE